MMPIFSKGTPFDMENKMMKKLHIQI